MMDFPASPTVGTIVTFPNGQSYRWNGGQWDVITNAPVTEPFVFPVADMRLLSMALGVVGLNSKADGSGTNTKLWTDANNPSASGYAKFATGLIINWGTVTSNANGDANVTFAQAFTAGPVIPLGIVNTGSSVPVGNFYGATACNITVSGCAFQTRSVSTGAVGAAGSTTVQWAAIGR